MPALAEHIRFELPEPPGTEVNTRPLAGPIAALKDEIEAADAWVMRWFKPTPTNALRETEARYIRQFNPPWNVQGKVRGVAFQ